MDSYSNVAKEYAFEKVEEYYLYFYPFTEYQSLVTWEMLNSKSRTSHQKLIFSLTCSPSVMKNHSNNTWHGWLLPFVLQRSSSCGWKLFRREISQGQML